MLPQSVIQKKRDGSVLGKREMQEFFSAYLHGTVADYQLSAFLMAVYFRGMSFDETIALTEIFLESGMRYDLSGIPGRKVDKHSTGGVGDKTSLLLVPIVSAAGVAVPMISGRGLGHTGGTLDKLESIPGFHTALERPEFLRILRETGMAMAGQTEDIVPLDRRVYSLRDVTATVESFPLIAASIMSKKLAGGADALVLDVKTGAGAVMETETRARELAQLLARVGGHFGLPVTGFITRMDQPLGRAIGNWLEVVETVDVLLGRTHGDLLEVTLALAGAMIHQGRKAASVLEGIAVAEEMIRSGMAFQKFLRLVAAQGGDASYIEETLRYRPAAAVFDVYADSSGFVSGIDARALGALAVGLGAGRTRMDDTIDPTAGVVLTKKTGERVESEEPLCRLFSSVHRSLAGFREAARGAFRISASAPETSPPIVCYFDTDGFHSWTAFHPSQESV